VQPSELFLNQDIRINKPLGKVTPYPTRRSGELVKEHAWVMNLRQTLSQKSPDELDTTDIISWAGFHAQKIIESEIPPKAIIGLLPPFEEKSGSVPMCKHAMLKTAELTEFCNPGQTPVGGCDLPLYTICKQIQWKWKAELGEDKFVLILGSLHIEFVIENMLGKLLDGSGFAEVIEKAGVLTSGRAESVFAGTDTHLKRVRYTHQVFLAACMILCDEAYEKHLEDVDKSVRGTWEVYMK
jgi:hypothetical protein